MTNPSAFAMVLTGNLATFSQIQHAAQQHGVGVIWGRDYDSTISKLPDGSSIKFLVADLSDDRIDCESVKSKLEANYPTAITIAFGPHVHEDRLNKAAQAGFTQVMTRGRFFHILGEVFEPV
jgi:hypothetical protein